MGRLGLTLFTVLLSARFALAAIPAQFYTGISYDVALTASDLTRLDSITLSGTVTMSMTYNVASGTRLYFHYGSLMNTIAVSDVSLTQVTPGGTTPAAVTISSVTASPTLGIYTVTTADNVVSGNSIVLTVRYSTRITTDMRGLFYRQFQDNGANSAIFLTNLKPNHARDMFPCLDEPWFPATYSIRLTLTALVPNVRSTLTITAPSSTNPLTYTFSSATRSYPPNVLSFFLAPSVMTETVFSPAISFWTRSGYTGTAVTDNMRFLANYYYAVQNFLGMTHPLGRINIVMVPNLASPLAGYGFIYIREDSYAIDYTSPQNEGLFKLRVWPVVYQFLRQFTEFSTRPNLWSDSWISEAFARYLQFTLFNSLGLPMDIKTELEVVSRQTALTLDATAAQGLGSTDLNGDTVTSSAIRAAVTNPLRSHKGAVLLSMMDLTLPPGSVFKSIKYLLTARANTQISATDFFTLLNTDLGTDYPTTYTGSRAQTFVTEFSSAGRWYTTPGYGLITVTIRTTGTRGSVDLALSALTGSTAPGYSVPVAVGSRSAPREYITRQDIFVLSSTATAAEIEVAAGDWVVANQQSAGYYRVQLPNDDWTRIVAASRNDSVPGRTRLIDDAFALSLATGTVGYNTTLQLVLARLREPLYRNWYPVASGLAKYRDSLFGLSQYESYRSFMRPFLQVVNEVLQNGTLNNYERARVYSLFLDSMCEFNISTYRSDAASNVTSLLNGDLPTTTPSSSYDAVVCCAARYSTTLIAQALWTIVSDTSSSFYKKHYNAVALGCLSNFTTTSALFGTMLASTDVQVHPHLQTVFKYLAENHPSGLIATMTGNAAGLQTVLGAPIFAQVVTAASRKINNATLASGLSSLSTASNVDPIVVAAATAASTAISNRVTWLTTNGPALATALDAANLAPKNTTSGATATMLSSLLLVLPLIPVVMAAS